MTPHACPSLAAHPGQGHLCWFGSPAQPSGACAGSAMTSPDIQACAALTDPLQYWQWKPQPFQDEGPEMERRNLELFGGWRTTQDRTDPTPRVRT
eukprot:3730770-Karenia_brevis.AAC.1